MLRAPTCRILVTDCAAPPTQAHKIAPYRRILAKAEEAKCAIILPTDAIVAYYFEANAPSHDYGVDAIPEPPADLLLR